MAVRATAVTSQANLPEPAQYRPYTRLKGVRNIIVDGAPVASTELTLSHWPNNATPEALKRDTSTAIVFAYLERPEFHQRVPYVSNNHFDEDGLFSMFALCSPADAMVHRELLIDASMAGDFGVFTSRDAARLCFCVESLADPSVSPLPASVFSGCEAQRTAALYNEVLERLPELLDNIQAHKSLWQHQDEHLQESLDLVETGSVQIREDIELDLAIVSVPAALPARPSRRYLTTESWPIHPFAVHRHTERVCLARLYGRRYELQYRYENWVQLVSRRPRMRVEFAPIVAALNDAETAPGRWRADPLSDISPRLWLDGAGDSHLMPAQWLGIVMEGLDSAPLAWDPYDWKAS